MANKLVETISKTNNLVSSMQTDAVKAVIRAVQECKKIEQNEATKREQIRADRDAAIAKIKNAREIIEKIVDRTFDERKIVLKTQLKEMETALRTGNIQALNCSLNAMAAVLQVDPIENIVEISRKIANNEYTLTLDDKEE